MKRWKTVVAGLVAATCLASAGAAPATGQDTTMDRVVSIDQGSRYGRAWSESTSGGSLAWSEGYYTDSYMDMYEATGARYWLDKMVDHTDRMMANAVDHDGDGKKGWADFLPSHNQIANDTVAVQGALTTSPDLLANGSFEAGSGVPAGWTATGGTGHAIRSTAAGDAHSGTAGVVVTSDGSNVNRMTQDFSYSPRSTYQVEAFMSVQTEQTEALVEIYNATTGVVVASMRAHHVGFERYVFTFVAPPTGLLQVRLSLQSYDESGHRASFDDVSIRAGATPAAQVLANRGFDSVDAGDPTLPANWTRVAGTTSANAHLVSGINNAYSGAKGLAIAPSAGATTAVEQTISYVAGATYVVSYWVRTTNPVQVPTISVENITDSVTLGSTTSAGLTWSQRSFRFIAPAAGKTVKLRISQSTSTSSALGYVDLASLVTVDTTEAAGWTRSATTALADAHRSTDSSVFADGAGFELVAPGGAAPLISQPLLNYRPNVRYGIAFSGAVATLGTTGTVNVRDTTTATVLGTWSFSGTGALTRTTGDFTTPAAGHDLVVELTITAGTAGQTVWVDTIAVAEYFEHQVQEGVIAAPILRFVNAIRADSTLHATYLSKAEGYRDFIAANLVHKWDPEWKQITGTDGANNGTGVYTFPEGLSTDLFPGRSLPHNQYLAFARMLYLLWDATAGDPTYATERAQYLSRANDMARAFQATLDPHPLNASLGTDAYLWRYWDPMGPWDLGHFSSYTQEDTSHAALTVIGALEAYHHGQVFTATDLARFTRTFTDVMWDQNLTEPVIAAYNSRRPSVTADRIRTNQVYRWAWLAEFDPQVNDIVAGICQNDPCPITLSASLAKWSTNKQRNGGFESASIADATLPAGWHRWQSTAATAARTATDPGLESWATAVTTNGTSWQVLEQELNTYEPNTDYTISFLGRRLGTVDGRVQVYDATTGTVLGSLAVTGTSWTRMSFTARTPVAGHVVKVRLYTMNVAPAGQTVMFDDVRALPSLARTEASNAGFENLDRWDPSLPAFWSRGATTAPANAGVDTTSWSAGNQSARLISPGTGAAAELSYRWTGYRPNGSYTLGFAGRATGTAGGRVEVIDTTTNTVLTSIAVTTSAWANHTTTFIAPAAHDHQLLVILRIDNPALAGTAWFDEVDLRS